MAKIVGFFEVENDTGDTVTNLTVKIEVAGVQVGNPISLPSLSNESRSLETQFNVDDSATLDWVVSFTNSSGKEQTGSINCNCTAAAANKLTKVTLKASSFTIAIPDSGTCKGSYSS